MSNPGMDADVFEQFIEQLHRYVRERLIPAEKAIVEADEIPADILAEMQGMGMFGLTIPEAYGGAGMNDSQYVRTIHTIKIGRASRREGVCRLVKCWVVAVALKKKKSNPTN